MSFLSIKRKLTRKPNNPKLNYSHPIMRNHACSTLFAGTPERSEGRVEANWTNNAVTLIPTKEGVAAKFASNDTSDAEYLYDAGFGTAWQAVTGRYSAPPFAFSFGFNCHDITPTDDMGIFDWGSVGGTLGIYIWLTVTGELYCSCGHWDTNKTTFQTEQDKHYDAVYKVNADLSSALFINDVLVDTGTAATVPNGSYLAARIGTCFHGTYANSLFGEMSHFDIFLDAMSDADAKSLSANPSKILKSKVHYLDITPAVGGGRIMSSLTAKGGLAGYGGIAGIGGGLAG